MSDNTIGPSERDRMFLAQKMGARVDEEYRRECARLGLDHNATLAAPLSLICMRRYLLAERAKGRA
jgi:hypothetical protein